MKRVLIIVLFTGFYCIRIFGQGSEDSLYLASADAFLKHTLGQKFFSKYLCKHNVSIYPTPLVAYEFTHEKCNKKKNLLVIIFEFWQTGKPVRIDSLSAFKMCKVLKKGIKSKKKEFDLAINKQEAIRISKKNGMEWNPKTCVIKINRVSSKTPILWTMSFPVSLYHTNFFDVDIYTGEVHTSSVMGIGCP